MMQEVKRTLLPLLPRYPKKLLGNYIRFWRSFFAYGRLQGKAPCALGDLDLQIGDWHATTPINHYFFQDTWAFHKIAQTHPAWHADIGSTALLVGCLAGIVPTLSVDIRPLAEQGYRYEPKAPASQLARFLLLGMLPSAFRERIRDWSFCIWASLQK